MANYAHTTPRSTGDHYVAATNPVTVRFDKPLKDRRRRCLVAGAIRGVMYRDGAVHHYRVAGGDGVLYLAPPSWFCPAHTAWFMSVAFPTSSLMATKDRINALFDLLLAEQQPERDGVPA